MCVFSRLPRDEGRHRREGADSIQESLCRDLKEKEQGQTPQSVGGPALTIGERKPHLARHSGGGAPRGTQGAAAGRGDDGLEVHPAGQNSCLLRHPLVLYSVKHMLFINLYRWKPPKRDIF